MKPMAKTKQTLPLKRIIVVLGFFLLVASIILLALRGAIIPGAILAAMGLLAAYLAARISSNSALRDDYSNGSLKKMTTDYFDIKLNTTTSIIRGTVRKGLFSGQRIADLHPAELALIWQDCRADDPRSARLLEAHLDALHPHWREDVRRGEEHFASGPDGRMNIKEAFKILGLTPSATRKQVATAHRDLMLKLHPDRGGSTYLASKVNEAKDVLLSNIDR